MIDFAEFHFLRPEWFWALLPLGILLLLTFRLFKQQSGWQSVLASHLYKHVISETGSVKKRPPMSLLAIGWILAVTALAGPTWQQLPQPVYQLNTGKVVLLDMSMSMRATDVKPNRLERAKYKAIDLINSIGEGDIGLVAYAGDAFTISPLSSDAQNLTTLLPSLTPEIMPVQGSEPFLGLKAAAELLKNAGYLEGEVFWITDGIEMAQVAELRELISELPYRISVLGIGTADGAPIQLLDGDFLKDPRGAIVVPKLNGNILSGIARATGGRYSSITANDNDLDRLLGQSLINRDTQQEDPDSESEDDSFGDKWQESGPYLILLLVPLAAFGFRRGYITLICVGVLSAGMQPNSAMALEWTDVWKTKDQQAAESFKSEDFEKAANTFDDPLWKGSALYKNGEYESALSEFAKVQGTESLYNQGNTLAKLGKLDEAISTYQQVLDQQPEHEDAKANKELLEQLKQQQQDQEQQQNKDQDQSDQEQQDNDEQNQQQDGEQQEDQQEQDQSKQENQQSEGQDSEQDPQQNEQQQEQSESEKDSEEQLSEEQKTEEQAEQEPEESEPSEESQQLAQESDAPLTDEEREQMQRMQNLLNKIPDDPAFLLKRKMMLENQQRRRETAPSQSKRNW